MQIYDTNIVNVVILQHLSEKSHEHMSQKPSFLVVFNSAKFQTLIQLRGSVINVFSSALTKLLDAHEFQYESKPALIFMLYYVEAPAVFELFRLDSPESEMSGRNRGPPIPAKGLPHGGPPQAPIIEPHFARGIRGPIHHALHEEVREARYSLSGPRQLPPHPLIFEERLAVQHDDIQLLLVDNQKLAATHVGLKQELEVTQYELQRADKYAQTLHAEKDLQMRQLFDKSIKMENDLNAINAMKSELMQVHMDIKDLTAGRQDLTAQVQMMTQDLGRVTSDLQQVPAVKAEIEGLRHETERVRAAIEHEKKSFAESFEHGKVMESKLITMAREMEKLRAELANAEKRAPAGVPVGNPGVNYNASYVNPESGYPGNPYPVGYGMMPANSMHTAPGGPGGGAAWGSYDPQRAQGSR